MDMKANVEVWITDLHILCIAGDRETIRLYFNDPAGAALALEKLLESPETKQG
jgi:hypothetical protein